MMKWRCQLKLQQVGNYHIFEAIYEVGELVEKHLYFQRAGKLEINSSPEPKAHKVSL